MGKEWAKHIYVNTGVYLSTSIVKDNVVGFQPLESIHARTMYHRYRSVNDSTGQVV